MNKESWFEPNMAWFDDNYSEVSFNRDTGIYTFRIRDGLKASVKPYAFWATFDEDSNLTDTVWDIVLFDDKGNARKFTLDMKKYSLPFYWAHYQRPNADAFYTTVDCHEVSDFIVAIWNALYCNNKESYGFICAAWLAGFNFT